MTYVPLWCKSNYSFLEGASHPEELVEEASRLGLAAIAITDRNGLYGQVRAYRRGKELGVKIIVGAEVTLEGGFVVVLVQDEEGYSNLCRVLSLGLLRSKKGECLVRQKELAQYSRGLILLVPNCEEITDELLESFEGRTYVVARFSMREEDMERRRKNQAFVETKNLPVVATNEVLYHHVSRKPLHDIVTCIRGKTTLYEAGRLLSPNCRNALPTPEEMSVFPDAWIQESRNVARRCTFSLEQLSYRYPGERTPEGETAASWLRLQTERGARRRYPSGVPPAVHEQLAKELTLIEELEYCGYFLTMFEIVRFCQEKNILCQGRGSAANSAVCYCLGITSVDPQRVHLLFERFLSRERAEPPDIDLDIEHQRREEVIQWVYKRYGRDRAAMVANVIRYRGRSAIREVGKVFGLSEVIVDQVSKLLSHHGELNETTLLEAGLDIKEDLCKQVLYWAQTIQGVPRHLSIHPGGFLLGDRPVNELVPVENGSMPGRTVIQWDKDDIETMGFFKVDLLGLGALSVVHRCFDTIEKTTGRTWSMATIPGSDRPTYDMISQGDTVGVFQIESRAQMSMLPRLRPRHYYDLVVQISLVRPGPISGGMVHPYLRRRNQEEAIEYPHPALEPVLKRTLGVPLFQEQVMELAVVAAGYSPGEADQLRRDMAAWRRSGKIDGHRKRLISGMAQKGISEEFAERIFQQIRGFGEYGFPESHAASFALIAYATSWLKCHYPTHFLCAMLNSQPMGFYSPSTLIGDGKRHGVIVLPVDLHRSQWGAILEPLGSRHWAVRLGFSMVSGLSQTGAEGVIQGRKEGLYRSVGELCRKTSLSRDEVVALAEAGAFRGISLGRREALWQTLAAALARKDSLDVCGGESTSFPKLSRKEEVQWDYERMGVSTRAHPLATFRRQLTKQSLPTALQVGQIPDGRKCHFAGMVICRQRPMTASGVVFLTLEDETGVVNAVVWPAVFAENFKLLKTLSFLGLSGRIQNKDSVVHLVVERVWEPQLHDASPVDLRSRNFH